MAMTDVEPLFVDSNILFFASVVAAQFHEQAMDAIKAAHQLGPIQAKLSSAAI